MSEEEDVIGPLPTECQPEGHDDNSQVTEEESVEAVGPLPNEMESAMEESSTEPPTKKKRKSRLFTAFVQITVYCAVSLLYVCLHYYIRCRSVCIL